MKISNITSYKFNNIQFKSNTKIRSANSFATDSIELNSKTKKLEIAQNIAKATGLKKAQAQEMVDKYYNSDKYKEITDKDFWDFVNDATGKPLTPEEAVVYLNYKMDHEYELYGEDYLTGVSPLELPKYYNQGLDSIQAATIIKTSPDSKELKKYIKFIKLSNNAKFAFYKNDGFNSFMIDLAKDDSEFKNLTKDGKKSGMLRQLNPEEAIKYLYLISVNEYSNDEFTLNDKKEIINHFLWKQNKEDRVYFEDSVELIRENKDKNEKTPDYIIYLLNSKYKTDLKSAAKIAENKDAANNLDKIISLITKDSKGKSKAGTYRILTPNEALIALKYKLNKKQTNHFLELIDYKGSDPKDAARRVLNKD